MKPQLALIVTLLASLALRIFRAGAAAVDQKIEPEEAARFRINPLEIGLILIVAFASSAIRGHSAILTTLIIAVSIYCVVNLALMLLTLSSLLMKRLARRKSGEGETGDQGAENGA